MRMKDYRKLMFKAKNDGTTDVQAFHWSAWKEALEDGWINDPTEFVLSELKKIDACPDEEAARIQVRALVEIHDIALNYSILTKKRLHKFGREVFGLDIKMRSKRRDMVSSFEKHMKDKGVWLKPLETLL